MKSKVLKVITATVSVALATVIVVNTIASTTLEAEAADTMQGIENLIAKVQTNNTENPEKKFTILEIVPTAADAEIGYLFSGYEPVLSTCDPDTGKWVGWKKNLAQQKNESDRKNFIGDVNNGLIKALNEKFSQQSSLKDSISVQGEYTEVDVQTDGFEALGSEEKYGSFIYNDTASVKYAPIFYSKIYATPVEGEGSHCYYKVANTKNVLSDGTLVGGTSTTSIDDNTILYTKNSDNTYSYAGLWKDLRQSTTFMAAPTRFMLPSKPEDNGKKDVLPGDKDEEDVLPDNKGNEDVPPVDEKNKDVLPDNKGNEDVPPVDEKNKDVLPDNKGNEDVPPVDENNKDVLPKDNIDDEILPKTDELKDENISLNVYETQASWLNELSITSENKAQGGTKATEEEKPNMKPVVMAAPVPPAAPTAVATDYYVVQFIKADSPSVGDLTYLIDNSKPICPSDNGLYEFNEENDQSLTGFQFYNLSNGNIYFKDLFQNNELFRRHVLNMDFDENNVQQSLDKMVSDFPVEVITLTYDKLATMNIPECDLIYFKGVPTKDITKEKQFEIFKYIFENTIPCIVDGSIIFKDEAGKKVLNDVVKANKPNLYKLAVMLGQETLLGVDLNTEVDSFEGTLAAGYEDGCFVAEYRYFIENGTSILDDFTTADDPITAGFDVVKETIENENIYRESVGKGPLDVIVSTATSVRHILNYKNKENSGFKEKLVVLELQPAKSSTQLTKKEIQEWAPGVKDVFIVPMTTAEFAGNRESLNDKYDMIYIGASTEHMNTVNGETVYNNGGLDGLIYHSTGDTTNTADYNGNDITERNLIDLEKFLLANRPIIVDEDLLTQKSTHLKIDVDNKRVESSSLMYKFLTSLDSKDQKKVFAKDKVVKAKDRIQFYLYEPVVAFKEISLEQADKEANENVYKLKRNSANYYMLDYRFTIEEIGKATSSDYSLNLKYDLGGAGQFNTISDNVVLYEMSENGDATPLEQPFKLKVNQKYMLHQILPQEFKGALGVQLEISSNKVLSQDEDGSNKVMLPVYTSDIRYIELVDDKVQELNILQIGENGENSVNIALQQAMADSSYYKTVQDLKEDYKFNFTFCSKDELSKNINGNAQENIPVNPNYLNQYDMIVFGFFSQEYDISDEKVLKAIKSYIDSGKSVLFTANTVDLKEKIMEDPNPVTKNVNNTYAYINENKGLRYYNIDDHDNNKIMEAGKDFGSLLTSNTNDSLLAHYPFDIGLGIEIGKNSAQSRRLDFSDNDITDKVLNNDNLIVLYCLDQLNDNGNLKDTMYSLSPNDAMNNYYLYSQDNVFFTAFDGKNIKSEELKLFYNTLLACFNSGIKDPKIKIVENGLKDAPEITAINRLFDESLGTNGEVVNETGSATERIYFTVRDSNFKATGLKLAGKFFYAQGGVTGSQNINYNGVDISVSELEPNVHLVDENGNVDEAMADINNLQNGMTYCIDVKNDIIANCEKGLNLYFELQSTYRLGDKDYTSNKVYSKLDVIKLYLFELR